jgi:DNA-binding CsgD family transcriptional regulator
MTATAAATFFRVIRYSLSFNARVSARAFHRTSHGRTLESIRHSSYLWNAVATLSSSDAERLLRFVGEAERIGGDHPFTPDLLSELGRLVRADWIAYSELDAVRSVLLFEVEHTGDECGIPFPDPLWHEVVPTHPVRVAHRGGYAGALKVSDFLSGAELRRSRLYEWQRQFGVTHSMEIPLFHSRWRPTTLHFDRFGGPDFSERDRELLDILQPHLARLWRAPRTRRLLRAALTELNRRPHSHGVVLLDGAGTVDFASQEAKRLLRVFFPDNWGRHLPPRLAEWVESDSVEPLRQRRDGRVLIVEREMQTLLLSEERAGAQLTDREQEVLAWVARGKTNAEIAQLLCLAPSTIRKHLENVYAKLGVRTRTAAVAHFLGLIEAEAS